jgi:hypothetical protein
LNCHICVMAHCIDLMAHHRADGGGAHSRGDRECAEPGHQHALAAVLLAEPAADEQAARSATMTGVRAIGRATPIASRQARIWRSRPTGAAAELSLYAISDAAPGTTCGNHHAHSPRHLRTSHGMVFAVKAHEPTPEPGRDPGPISPYKRDAGGSNPPAPTKVFAAR